MCIWHIFTTVYRWLDTQIYVVYTEYILTDNTVCINVIILIIIQYSCKHKHTHIHDNYGVNYQ